jgi:hypothetical protein
MQHPEEEIELQKRAGDKVTYYGLTSKVLGAIQLVAGLLSMALGVGAICTVSSGYDIGYGIWAGFMFCLTGIFGICANYHRNTCLITTTMTLCVISAVCGIVQFSLGIVAAVNDRERSRTGELSRDRVYLSYDIYYQRNDPFHYLYSYYCTETYGAFTWEYAWGPVDVLLLLVGIIETFLAIASAGICCQSICCGIRRVYTVKRGAYVGQAPSFYNEGYAESRVSAPTILKVVPDSQPQIQSYS